MEKNKLIKYKSVQLQNIGNKIVITNKILNEIQKKPSTDAYIGNNERNIVIIIKEISPTYVNEITLEQINSILESCKIEISEVAIFNIEKEKIQIDDLIDNLSPNIILLFDINSQEITLPISINYNEIQTYKGCKILLAVSFESLFQKNNIESTERKLQLWRSLNNIFETFDEKTDKVAQEFFSILKTEI